MYILIQIKKKFKLECKAIQYLHYNIAEPRNKLYKLLLKVNTVILKNLLV